MHALKFGHGIFRTNAFTLVELLIVSSILIVLAAIAIPVARGTLDRSSGTKCVNNLRQWGIAVTTYLTDSNGFLPFEGGQENPTWAQVRLPANETAWFNVLPPYVSKPPLSSFNAGTANNLYTPQTAGILQCPSAKWQGNEASRPGPIFSYAWNSKLFGGGNPTSIHVSMLSQETSPSVNRNRRAVGASVVPMIVETRASLREPRVVAGTNDEFGKAFSYTRQAINRHDGRINMVFFDGSVRSYKPEEIMAANGRNTDQSPVIWNPWNPDAAD